jgi:hypothetical protein
MNEKEGNEREGAAGQAKALDEKLLGQRLPAIDWIRDILLMTLEDWLHDPERGRQWIWDNRERLLAEAALLNKERANFLAKNRKISFGDSEILRILEGPEKGNEEVRKNDKEKTISLVTHVPERISLALRRYLAENGITMTSFVSEALEKALKDRGAL